MENKEIKRKITIHYPYGDADEGKAVIIAEILCNPGLCSVYQHKCRSCIEKASEGYQAKVKEAEHRYKMENSGAHHLLGGWKVNVLA